MTNEKKINIGIAIAICIGAGLVAVAHPDCAFRMALTFVVLALFEWWYVRKLVKESDEPKPEWYPLKIVLAVVVGILLLCVAGGGGGGGHYHGDGDEGDPQWGR